VPKPTHVYVFVYGSLKEGFRLNGWLTNAEVIGPDKLYRHALISMKAFPAMLFTDNPKHSVTGEVYRVPAEDFRKLRAMEEQVGYETEQVETMEGRPVYTFVYLALPAGQYTWTEALEVEVKADDDDIPF
jgi:gamma-glutamylcyclotransferase (GGCT)/AIG2-like uncharacterized protein YtfP